MLKNSLILLVAALAALCFFGPAFSQGDMTVVNRDVFTAPRRPAAFFAHDQHNEKAQIEDCAACHHGETDGKMDAESTSEGTPCADCHPVVATPGKTPLMRAFHKQCAGCHMDKKAGPVACGQCHVG